MIKSIVFSMLLSTAITVAGPGVTGPGAAGPEGSGQEEDFAQTSAAEEGTEASGTELIMLSSAGGVQMLGVVIHSEDGSTVVIDGGCDEDGDQLLETIKSKGTKVDA